MRQQLIFECSLAEYSISKTSFDATLDVIIMCNVESTRQLRFTTLIRAQSITKWRFYKHLRTMKWQLIRLYRQHYFVTHFLTVTAVLIPAKQFYIEHYTGTWESVMGRNGRVKCNRSMARAQIPVEEWSDGIRTYLSRVSLLCVRSMRFSLFQFVLIKLRRDAVTLRASDNPRVYVSLRQDKACVDAVGKLALSTFVLCSVVYVRYRGMSIQLW